MKRALTVVKIGVILIAWWGYCYWMSEAISYTLNHLPPTIGCIIETAHISICYITR